MIDARNITVVMQGNIRADTRAALESVRRVLPEAILVLSTFEGEPVGDLAGLADRVVLSQDPGPLPAFTLAQEAEPSNLNRQIVSTQAGLKLVETTYALKIRTDCVLESDAFVRIYELAEQTSGSCDRLVVSTFYTRHPRGLACYQCHASDWFVFGRAHRVQMFWDVPLFSPVDAAWFEHHEHEIGSTATARRFRAKYTPEQHMAVHFARKLGYEAPAYLNEFSEELVQANERMIGREFLVAEPRRLGIVLPKYRHLPKSLYMRLDCVAMSDWLRFFMRELEHVRSAQALQELQHMAGSDLGLRILRGPAHGLRHQVISLMLGWKGIRKAILRKKVA